MIKTIHRQVLVWVLWVLPFVAVAQPAIYRPIHLKGGNLLPAPNTAAYMDSLTAGGTNTQPVQVLLHFATLPTAAQRQSLAANGITLLDYIPDNTYTAIIRQSLYKMKTAAAPIHSIVSTQPEWKADAYLWRKAAKEAGAMKVLVSVYEGTGAEELRAFVASLGGQVLPGSMGQYGYYHVAIAPAKLRNLAGWYAVRYISPLTEPALLDKQSVPAVKGNIAGANALWSGYALNGDSVCIGVGDNTSGIFHTDTRDRITNYNPAQMTNHGIHINGITGGAAILDPLAESMTPRVKLLNFFFSTVLSSTGAMLQDHNMTITNNSYTVVENDCDYFGTYDLYSRFLDTQALQYPVVQHVFAAGNDGELSCPPHAPGYATMGGGYQPSKNTLVVGSVAHNFVQAWDQSRGPVRDGRLKPDMVAVGASVYSGLRNNTYGWAGGTSMAAPQAASGLAVLTQHYKRLHGDTQPRADLLKTIMLAAAMDLGNAGPDYSYGFGMMDINRSLRLLDNNQYHTGNINNGDSQTITITIPAGITQAKVTLNWNDVPASPSAATQLVNDLDMTVTRPGGMRHLPLGLDAAPANAQNVAIEKPDHLNNVEQVTIKNPAAGTYTITIRGHNIPLGPQHYVVAWDLLPKAVQLTFPLGGEQLSNKDSLRIFWNSVADGNTFSVDLSADNGSNWLPIANDIPATAHYIGIVPIGINSGNCMVRMRRNGTAETAVSQRFAISEQPAVALASSQCPGYVNIHWSPVPGATAYQVMKKSGAQMVVVDTATDTAYSFGGMPLNDVSYVAVQPILNGLSGYRSLAVASTANYGDCMNPASVGDLMAEKIVSPGSGRLLTSTAPGVTSTLSVQLRNLYTADCSSYTLAYKVNSGAWQTLVSPGIVLAGNNSTIVDIPGISFATPGDYQVTVAIHNNALPDPQAGNDTLTYVVKCLPNDPVDLSTPFTDDFESLGKFVTTHDSMGVTPNGHWDFFNDDDSGRIRSYVYDEVTIGGNRSISLDQFMPMRQGSNNVFAGTFNLSGYDTSADEVRVDFDYLLHNTPDRKAGNLVMARANDGTAWRAFAGYDFTSYPGTVKRVLSLSLSDAVRLAGLNFSTSTQIAFGQNDTSLIAGRSYGNGLTFDNFRMYTVANDAMLGEVLSPLPNNCGLPGSTPLTVKVRNGVNYTLRNVQLNYRLDSGTVYTATIDSIRAKDSINYTFAQPLTIGSGTTHNIDIWLATTGDTYKLNDSLLRYRFRNSKIITSYPYLENFEQDNGGFYDGGFMSSWQYGMPASAKINKAASGTKAWKSNLTGRHNSLETSYLYSPCYDISQLSNPMLSFSLAQDLENCGGILCDGAYMEYSFDGNTWSKLGAPGQGYNWYDSSFYIWNTAGFTRWHVASIRLPQPPATKVLHLRFVIFADPAVNFEGIAIDDIHIFDLKNGIHPATGITEVSNELFSNQWYNYTANNNLLASLQPVQQTGNTTVTLYKQDTVSNIGQTQYTFPRSYTIKTEHPNPDSMMVHLFLQDSDVVAVLRDTTCPSCTPIVDAYTLGVTQYYNANNRDAENGSLADDTGGVFVYHPAAKVQWIPYDNGYRAELSIKPQSELWFNNGGPTGTVPAGVDYLNFLAFRSGDAARIYWHSLIDAAVDNYTLQRSDSGVIFTDMATFAALHTNTAEYNYTDTTGFGTLPVRYYRLRWAMTGSGGVHYSPVRKVGVDDSAANLVQITAAMTGSNRVLVGWKSYIDGLTDHYLLERAIDNGSFTKIDNRVSAKRYGQQYYKTDAPGDIATGTPVHYRLTAILEDGTSVVLPVRTVKWVDGNAVTAIYPNPVHNGVFSIRWNADPGTVMSISITDITGKTLETTTVTAAHWDNMTTLKTTRYPQGVYIVRMNIGGYRHVAKLLFE